MSQTSWELKETPCYDLLNDCQDFNYRIVTGDFPVALLGKEAKAHGEAIINAVNAHQAMKEALEKFVRYWGKTGPDYAQYDKLEDYVQMAKRALTLAKGGTPDV